MTTERELREQEEEVNKFLEDEFTPRSVKQNVVIISVCFVILVVVAVFALG